MNFVDTALSYILQKTVRKQKYELHDGNCRWQVNGLCNPSSKTEATETIYYEWSPMQDRD